MTIEKVTIPVLSTNDIKDQFYTVLSIELGNTTIKSIIITTNIKTNKSYHLNKLVKLTRDIRLPKESEEVFGQTIWNKPLSSEAIEEAVKDIIDESLNQINLIAEDLDFVVRSTGVVAISSLSNEIGYIIKALSNGCLLAGVKPSQMRAPFSVNNIPEHIRRYSFFNNIEFDGSVVSIKPPKTTGIVSNQMESELVTAGIKLASKSSLIDYRNPVISIDMGTTLAGQVIDDSKPYANLLCNYVGLAGGISDIMLRGSNIIDDDHSTIDFDYCINDTIFDKKLIHENTIKLHKYIDVIEIPSGTDNFGLISIDSEAMKNSSIKVIGSRINNTKGLINKFESVVQDFSNDQILVQVDDFYAYLIKRLIDVTVSLDLIDSNVTLGITGRAGITGYKPQFIEEYLKDKFENIIFTEDGLALGSLMMARCMNSLGSPTSPIGGSKRGMCIMQQRIKYNK